LTELAQLVDAASAAAPYRAPSRAALVTDTWSAYTSPAVTVPISSMTTSGMINANSTADAPRSPRRSWRRET
jgi:hypothetical protein